MKVDIQQSDPSFLDTCFMRAVVYVLLFAELKTLDTKVPSKIATSEQICSMNPSCILKIVFDDTKSHLSLCSCINLANLEVSDRRPQSAEF
jgi:hypothetical protein